MRNMLPKHRWRTVVYAATVRWKSSASRSTAGIILIGDEILKAQVKDSNANYACKLLYKHGVKVEKISIIPDRVEDIVQEVRDFHKRFNYVFTSGGIGSTHDDLTYEAVALAFDDTLHYHPTLVDIIKNYFNYQTFPSPACKMAYIPTKSVLKFGTDDSTGQKLLYPCVILNNVHIFPGSPMFFEMSFRSLCKEYFSGNKGFATAEIFLNAREETFASILSEVAEECRNVSFGSYPESNRYYKVRVTLESENEEDLEAAKKTLCERLPANMVTRYDCSPHVDCLAKYEAFVEKSPRRSTYESAFKKIVNYYRDPETVYVFLDDSQESVLLIHLARIAANKQQQRSKWKVHALYLKDKDHPSRPEMMKFFHELCDRYDVDLHCWEINKSDVISAVRSFIVTQPELRVLLVGKRSIGNERDVYRDLRRLNDDRSVSVQVLCPLLDWSDEDTAAFSNSLSLPYFKQDS